MQRFTTGGPSAAVLRARASVSGLGLFLVIGAEALPGLETLSAVQAGAPRDTGYGKAALTTGRTSSRAHARSLARAADKHSVLLRREKQRGLAPGAQTKVQAPCGEQRCEADTADAHGLRDRSVPSHRGHSSMRAPLVSTGTLRVCA
uniref:Uncharacterized protein n=1 Tax=Knipowitschia caucasica TaxID=637954 RepID=A0AAV2K2V9_KNICA